jgi:tetratricopeptide (TPR) repeat protein
VLSSILGSHGRYAEALEQSNEALRIAQEIGHLPWLVVGGIIIGETYRHILAPEEARRRLEAARDMAVQTGSTNFIQGIAAALAMTYTLAGDIGAAEAALGRVSAALNAIDQTLSTRLCRTAWAELSLARGDAGQALAVADQLIATAPSREAAAGPLPWLELLRSQALLALGRAEEAEDRLVEALEFAQRLEAPGLQWRLHAVLGHVHASLRRPADAQREGSAANSLVADLAAAVPGAGLRHNFRKRATAFITNQT